MKNWIIYIGSCFCLCLFAHCTSEAKTFDKTIEAGKISRAITVEQLDDGEFITTGFSTNETGSDEDVLVIKTSDEGDTIWTKRFGGVGKDFGWAIRADNEDGFIVTGYSSSFGSEDMNVYLLKLDKNGRELWSKTIGQENEEYGWDVRVTKDNGYIIAAQKDSSEKGDIDAQLIKTDNSGNVIWTKVYGGGDVDRVFSVQETKDGNFVAAGISYSFDVKDRNAYILKTDPNGNLIWQKSIGGDKYDVGHSVTISREGGYLMAGYGESLSENGGRDAYLIKLDDSGEQEWIKVYGGKYNERLMKAIQTLDGGYIAVGFQQIYDDNEWNWDWDLMLLKVDLKGKLDWARQYGDRNFHEMGYTVEQTKDKGYIISGWKQEVNGVKSYALLLKTDHKGKIR